MMNSTITLTIFDGENTGRYDISTVSMDKNYLKIMGQFKVHTQPENFEVFAVSCNFNTISI